MWMLRMMTKFSMTKQIIIWKRRRLEGQPNSARLTTRGRVETRHAATMRKKRRMQRKSRSIKTYSLERVMERMKMWTLIETGLAQ
jgi:hypothetical protein